MSRYVHEYEHAAALREDELRGYLDRGWAPVPDEQFEICEYVHPLGLIIYKDQFSGWRLCLRLDNGWNCMAMWRGSDGESYLYDYLGPCAAMFDGELLIADPSYARHRFLDSVSHMAEAQLRKRKEALP